MTTMLIKIFILALIGSAIGYITNVIAIKLLFKPYDEIRMPLIGFKIQGLIPMRQKEIAKSIGFTVENELLSVDELMDGIITEKRVKTLMFLIQEKIKSIIESKLSDYPFLFGFKGMIMKQFSDIMENEGEEQIREFLESFAKQAKNEINISAMVEEKINSFDLAKLEELAYEIARKELRHIEILGGFLGFAIGIVQGIIIHLF